MSSCKTSLAACAESARTPALKTPESVVDNWILVAVAMFLAILLIDGGDVFNGRQQQSLGVLDAVKSLFFLADTMMLSLVLAGDPVQPKLRDFNGRLGLLDNSGGPVVMVILFADILRAAPFERTGTRYT